MLNLFLLKIIISVIIVLGITYIAEKKSTRFAGILMGFPMGTAIIILFLGLENGISFASSSAVWAINGLVAETIFVFCYFIGLKYFKRYSVILSPLFAFIGFFVSAIIIRHLPLSSEIISSLFLILFIILSFLLYKNIKIKNIKKSIKIPKISILYKLIFTILVVLVVTGISTLIGEEWSGILSSIPTNLIILLIIVHLSYSKGNVLTLIKGYPIGLIGLLIYLITIPFTYNYFGVILGTIISYLIAGIYLVIYEFLLKRFFKKI